MEWFRWYGGTLGDPKLQWVARQAGHSVASVLAVWVAVLERAHNHEQRGCCEGLDFESLDVVLGLDDGSVNDIFQVMIRKGMVVDGNMVAAWDKRQPKREDDNAAERKREYREKVKLQSKIDALQEQLTLLQVSQSRDLSHNVPQCPTESREVTTEERRVEEKRIKPKGEDDNEARATDFSLEVENKPTRLTMTDIRFIHSDHFGLQFPPGANNLAVEICERFSAEAIKSAFEAAAVHNKPNMAYVLGVLNGNGRPKNVLREDQKPRGRPVTFGESTSMANQEASQRVLRRLLDGQKNAGDPHEGGINFQIGGGNGNSNVGGEAGCVSGGS